MSSERTTRAFRREIASIAQEKLGRPLSTRERAFITSRGGFIALAAILDTVKASTAYEIEQSLNSRDPP